MIATDSFTESETKKKQPKGAEQSTTQEPVPRSSILYQPSKTSNPPFPSILKKQKKYDEDERLLSIFKQIHINLPFLEAMIHMPKGAKALKDLLSHKEKLEKVASLVKLSEECFAIIQRSLHQKEGDPKSIGKSWQIQPPCRFRSFRDGRRRVSPDHPGMALPNHGKSRDQRKQRKLSLRVKNETITFNIGRYTKSKHSHDDYLYYADHTAKLVQEQWVDTVNHNGKWTEEYEEGDSNNALTELPEHLEYTFLQENNQLPVVISSALSTDEKTRLLEVLRNHKGVIAWSIADIKGIKLSFCTHKILMEDEFKPSVQFQRRVNPNIKEVVKKEVIKLLDAGLIYPIFDSSWIPITPEDQEKTTFTCPYRTFGYRQMPFELCNAQATFQCCMTEGIFLGHKVSGSGIKVNKAKIEVISKLPYPTNVKAIRSFLGHVGFYRRFIKDFSQIARLMTQLLVKDAPFNFSEECIQTFNTLKHELTQAPIMIKPDWSLLFEIMCDASDYAVGAILRQRIKKHFKPIHCASKTMNEAQENYTTTEKELLAVVFAYDKLHAKPCLIRWILLLQEFDIKIHDKKGVENLAADHLSRLENPDLGRLTRAEIRDLFPEEQLMAVSDKNNEPWYPDYANYLASQILPFDLPAKRSKISSAISGITFGANPSYSNNVLTGSYDDAWPEMKQHKFFDSVTLDHPEDIMASPPP
nr:hypothetical protein [Tanacetum cinerariifolium]